MPNTSKTRPLLLVVASILASALVACGGESTTTPPGAGGGGGGGGGGSGGGSGVGGGGGGVVVEPDASVPPEEFWDSADIPAAQNVMMFKFLNRTNGVLDDDHIFWRFETDAISELHSLAEQPLYDMPANASGRLYIFLCPPDLPESCVDDPESSPYYDFIEHTIGPNQYNGNTTRVDAFGIKLALLLHCADGFERAVGEDYETFQEDRAVTFQKFLDAVPDEFDHLAEPPFAPYRIVEPGRGEFKVGGLYEHYYDAFIDELWADNALEVPKAGSNGSGLAAFPDLSAAIFRHVGAEPGAFNADGSLANHALWDDPATFYTQGPANYYAKFWHDHGLDGRAYGFPYDDVGSYSTYISHQDPEYMLVAIGW